MKLNSGALIGIYLVIILAVGALIPTPTVWGPKYGSEHKDPLGTYVLFHQLPDLFPGVEVTRSTQPLFNLLRDSVNQACYIAVNDSYEPDQLDMDYLLQFVHQGGHAFIAARRFDYAFIDTLGFDFYDGYSWPRPFDQDSQRMSFYLINEKLKADSAQVHSILEGSFLTDLDSAAAIDFEILGLNAEDRANFVRKRIGEGYLYLHFCPAAFSNYELIYQNTGPYVASCLSYLPSKAIIFDDYYKSGKVQNDSIFSVLFSYAPMRWAWNIAVFSIILFMIFGARRKARAIPVVKPYDNESLKFIETIGAMHYNHRNNQLIANKRLTRLKNYLQRRYRIQEADWLDFKDDVMHERTGVDRTLWSALYRHAKDLNSITPWETGKLRQLNVAIDHIYSAIKKSKNV
jgi:hypothetical protein